MITLTTASKVFLGFLFTKGLIDSYLNKRNREYVLKNKNKVPEVFEDQISLEDHQKAAIYTAAKSNTGQFFYYVNFVILLGWTLGGGLDYLDKFIGSFGLSQIMTGVVYFLSFGLINMILGLPEGLYNTFVLEEKFGFNKTTAKIFILDLVKGLIVGGVIGFLFCYAVLWIMNSAGDQWWIFAWAFITIFQLILLWAYPTFIAPLFNKFSPMTDEELKDKVLDLLNRTGFESNGLFVMNASIRSSHGNAYFTGLGKNKRIVFFDTLIKTLTPNEVIAVLAHELGHFKKKHILKSMIKGFILTFIGLYILGKLSTNQMFFEMHGVSTISNHAALMLFSMISGTYLFILTPINSFFSRKNEFEADDFAKIHASADDLITALVKLYKDNASTLTPDPLYSSYYHSHPPALIRVDHLKKDISQK